MKERISTLDVRKKLGEILNRVDLRNDQFIIERKGKPLAALVPPRKLEEMERAARLHLLRVLDVAGRRKAPLTQVEADSLSNEAKHRQRPRRRR